MSRRIEVKVVPCAANNEVLEQNGQYIVRTTTAPLEGKANERVIQLLSKYLGLPKSALKIVRGEKMKKKVIEISA